ncbi:hypothetical protein IAQ61_010849 [Plenodomus lingam]|uniref:LSM2-LSM8 complex subunit LSM8 n=1 Tax=Leptosphaeria maculans (strain JN3 / isolate v23.1.3 / race Av1-4-5-6-7-8) TaxID=985895 RepID=E4ZJ72_LEPMJ|nr:hypothetical protein LEMA_P070110.1 [Plenodomus lingam JN3]KAH9861113.1 hypothetical protein IAQ61_010849 [Plenodomus lingam]CBX91503.1 hypothetical protein LEMA_P070110.1 [Plenodomus lingam JN3]
MDEGRRGRLRRSSPPIGQREPIPKLQNMVASPTSTAQHERKPRKTGPSPTISISLSLFHCHTSFLLALTSATGDTRHDDVRVALHASPSQRLPRSDPTKPKNPRPVLLTRSGINLETYLANMSLNVYLNKRVSVLTLDGRTMVGTLHSCDNSMNLVLQNAIERIIRPREEEVPSEEVPLGLYIVRGDSVAVVGRLDEEVDSKIDWRKVHGEVLGSTHHV